MRKQFVKTVEKILAENGKAILLLGDIGVWGFREAFNKYPNRIYNIGILEQSTISLAAGLAKEGLIPIVHTIAPFLVERAYEQLKDDFGYQALGGNFVSVGASYDYAALGCTHHCPADIGALSQIPGMEIVLPGTAEEFDSLFNQSYTNGRPTYFRLSERQNTVSFKTEFGKAAVAQTGKLATVIAVGPMLNLVAEACKDVDVSVLYYNTISPFDADTLIDNCSTGKILICEPYYSGALTAKITAALFPQSLIIDHLGMPREFLTHYGHAEDHDRALGFTVENIKQKVAELIAL